MNPPRLKTEHQQQSESIQSSQTKGALEFETAEAMIRADQLQTKVPSPVRDRLVQSLSQSGPASSSEPWWRRLFRGRD